MSNTTLKDLARDVSAYLQELQGRDVPADLAWQLTRDYQLARCQALYGADQSGGQLRLQARDDGQCQLVVQYGDKVQVLRTES